MAELLDVDPDQVRISKIAGRYLVFDADSVARLRRQQNINGLLVGTTPQQPTQNIFLGLPIEIRPEEAGALVKKGAAYVVDDAAAHREALKDDRGREAYVESLRKQKVSAQRAIAEQRLQKAAVSASKKKKATGSGASGPSLPADDDAQFAGSDEKKHVPKADFKDEVAVTPTASTDLVSSDAYRRHIVTDAPEGPLVRLLQQTGYFMTPGLRFGSQYSVYPGDPLRFHAHFMANQYGWNQPIPMLEIVEGGRLATAVKKSFLIGSDDAGTGEVKTFSLEWAAM